MDTRQTDSAVGTLQRTVTLEENEIPPGAGSPWMGLAVGETHNRSSQGNDIALSNLPLHPQDERQMSVALAGPAFSLI